MSGVQIDRPFSPFPWQLPALFLAGRLILLMALPVEGLRGYGDFVHFYQLAGMGWPFVDYWVEFPPVFPFLSAALFQLAGGREHIYDYLLALLFSLVQAGNLILFLKLARRLHGESGGWRRAWRYFALLTGLFYGWGYFDPLAVSAMLLGMVWLLEGRDLRAGLALAAGMLVKWFPALALAVAWRYRPARRALLVTALAVGGAGAVIGGLYLASPEMTAASLRSQGSKGSWETVWALLDGNYNTGNFGPESERFDPATAFLPRGNPARIPPGLTVIAFAGLGGWCFLRARAGGDHAIVSFLGLTWCIFLLWSPGWSPQWVLYLLPLILLTLPEREGLLVAITLVLVNLLEWPVLLSRGLFWGLWVTVPLRTLLLILLAVLWFRDLTGARRPQIA